MRTQPLHRHFTNQPVLPVLVILLVSLDSFCYTTFVGAEGTEQKLSCNGVNAFEQQNFKVDLDIVIDGSSKSAFNEETTDVSLWTPYLVASVSGGSLLEKKGYWFPLRPSESVRFTLSACVAVDADPFKLDAFQDPTPVDDLNSVIDGNCSDLLSLRRLGVSLDPEVLDKAFVEHCDLFSSQIKSIRLVVHPWYNYFMLTSFPFQAERVSGIALNYFSEPLDLPNDAVTGPTLLGTLPGSRSSSGSTVRATEDRVPVCNESSSENFETLTGVWYAAETMLTLKEDLNETTATVTVCRNKEESGPPVGLNVYSESDEGLVCLPNLVRSAGREPCAVEFEGDAGTRYLFFVYGLVSPVPNFKLTVTLGSDSTNGASGAVLTKSSLLSLWIVLLLFILCVSPMY